MAEQWGSMALASQPAMVPFRGPSEVFRAPVQLQPARRIDLLAHLSGAFDLAEGQPVGHSARVAHVALSVARRLRLDATACRRVLYAGLLHDAGVPVRELPDGVDATGGHTAAGAWAAQLLGLDKHVQHAIRCSHERWDGDGRPAHLAGDAIPIEARIVSAAHWACDLIGPIDHPLRARAVLAAAPPMALEPIVGPAVARALREELREDALWMGVWDEQLPTLLAQQTVGDGRASVAMVERIAEAMGQIVDAGVREPGRSTRVGALAAEIGRLLGLDTAYVRAMRIAGLLLDIGQLGVPRHITEKPAILSLDEMEMMRRHPGWGARLLEAIPGLEDVGRWVESHHERPDGRGYPDLLSAAELPLASRVLAVADAYWAMRSDRPHRLALDEEQAIAAIEAGAGDQFDATSAELLRPALHALRAREPRAPRPAVGSAGAMRAAAAR